MRQNLYYPFEISYKEFYGTEEQKDTFTFFRLVYVLEGSGRQIINQNSFDYRAGHLLLVTPEDRCVFEISQPSKFLYVCFDDVYLRSSPIQVNCTERDNWIRRLEFILHQASHLPGCILYDPQDKLLVGAIIASMHSETSKKNLYSKELVQQLMNSLIVLVARAMAQHLPDNVSAVSDQKLIDVFLYIHENIHQPELLRTAVICDRLHMSPNYLGKYFRSKTGQSLQEYILAYKMKMIEIRLSSSDMRLNEIVREMNFTDESHLNRFFRKKHCMNPSTYRRTHSLKAII